MLARAVRLRAAHAQVNMSTAALLAFIWALITAFCAYPVVSGDWWTYVVVTSAVGAVYGGYTYPQFAREYNFFSDVPALLRTPAHVVGFMAAVVGTALYMVVATMLAPVLVPLTVHHTIRLLESSD